MEIILTHKKKLCSNYAVNQNENGISYTGKEYSTYSTDLEIMFNPWSLAR